MVELKLVIAEQRLLTHTSVPWIAEWLQAFFPIDGADPTGFRTEPLMPAMNVHIHEGGSPFNGSFHVDKSKSEDGLLIFTRQDYLITVDPSFIEAELTVYDSFALKHAMMHLYSLYIVHLGWGLLIHSSCVIDQGKAFLFSGHSGAGKSTAARLSSPRQLLSDEASIVRITADEVSVFDSPFRSELLSERTSGSCSLAGIYLLNQSEQIYTQAIADKDAFIRILDKVFYWSYDAAETMKIMKLGKMLAEQVPFHELYFQKNNLFWEKIS
ncbi:hypothetical protein [Paenibacillus wynnii]|uniref:hypothetical protein n=1 Tax=Paenibacillus wynnii TaxID=268407 RepID=UPI00068F6E9F|nr:hypothetical protein [Paenibacillus wynnii]